MRICLLTRALPYHQYGGLESHTVALAKALQNREHEITIITSAQPDDVRVENFQPLPFEIISLPKTQPGKYTFSFFRESAKVINQLDKQYQFDIIHSQGFAGFGYMFRKSKPLVVTIHGTLTSETMLFPQKFSLPNLWKYRKRLGVSPLYHQLLNRADAVLVDSHFSEQLLLREHKKIQPKLAVVYLGIDPDYFVPYDKIKARQQFGFSDEYLILALGRITESKGFQILLNAVNRIQDIPYQVVIAGEGPYC
ncbi:MAG: glycosyltransferase family 4 protein, partial [bacterium]|nr:glycosyltransferase family 4 protein [bacterium]